MVYLRNLINLSLALSGIIEPTTSLLRGGRMYSQQNTNIEVPKFDLSQMQDNKFTESSSCCIICPDGLTKYYSVSTWFGNCGETCIDPDDYDIYQIFEPGLSLATTNTICEDLGYSIYTKTERHGVWPIAISVDMYKKPPIQIQPVTLTPPRLKQENYKLIGDCPALTVSCEYLPGLFQCCPSGESCIPNVGCRC
jgi:hypothetical protein